VNKQNLIFVISTLLVMSINGCCHGPANYEPQEVHVVENIEFNSGEYTVKVEDVSGTAEMIYMPEDIARMAHYLAARAAVYYDASIEETYSCVSNFKIIVADREDYARFASYGRKRSNDKDYSKDNVNGFIVTESEYWCFDLGCSDFAFVVQDRMFSTNVDEETGYGTNWRLAALVIHELIHQMSHCMTGDSDSDHDIGNLWLSTAGGGWTSLQGETLYLEIRESELHDEMPHEHNVRMRQTDMYDVIHTPHL
jgi:hypothetical protein